MGLSGLFAGYYLANSVPATAQLISQLGRRYRVPDVIDLANDSFSSERLDKIINAMYSDLSIYQAAKDNQLVPVMIDMLQSNHQELTGFTYGEHLSGNFSKGGLKSTTIDVLIIPDYKKNNGVDARFVHSKEAGMPNLAFIDAGLRCPTFLYDLDHELVHGVYGTGETRAYGYAHRDIANIVSRHSELLLKDDSRCVLTNLMKDYLSYMGFKDTAVGSYIITNKTGQEILRYLFLLTAMEGEKWESIKGNTKLDKAAEFLTHSISERKRLI